MQNWLKALFTESWNSSRLGFQMSQAYGIFMGKKKMTRITPGYGKYTELTFRISSPQT